MKLLTTIGLTCSKSAKFKELVDNAVQYLINLKNEKAVSSRVRFSIMDLCDLRANDWIDEKNKLQTKEDLRLQSTLKQLDKKDMYILVELWCYELVPIMIREWLNVLVWILFLFFYAIDQVKLRPQTSGTKASDKSKEPVPLTESERSTVYFSLSFLLFSITVPFMRLWRNIVVLLIMKIICIIFKRKWRNWMSRLMIVYVLVNIGWLVY